jgi:hypothetical protein
MPSGKLSVKRCSSGHRAGSQNRFVCTIQGPVSLTIGGQNAIKSCRWSSSFYLHAVLRKK